MKDNTIMTTPANNISRTIFYVSCIFIVASLFSCTKDDSLVEDGDYITFNIETPYYSPLSYSMDAAAESTIRSIDVLAFREDENDNKEYFKFRSEATSISDKEGDINTKQFSVQVKTDEGKYRFVVLANVKAELDKMAISTTGTKDQVLARVLSKSTEQWDATSSSSFTPIPMWGETKLIKITDEEKTISGIKMIRSLAAIDVLVAPTVQTKFKLKEVHLYNRKTRGRVVPIAANYSAADGKVTAPSLPVDGDPSNPLTILNDGPGYTTTDETKLEKSIYTYETVALESGADLKATCIVVGGKYDEQTNLTYYRIDFKRFESDGTTFKEYLNLLRNHRYIVTIKSVSATGYPSPDEAFLQKKGGLSAHVQEWNMSEIPVKVSEPYTLTVEGSINVKSAAVFYGNLSVLSDNPKGWENPTGIPSWMKIIKVRPESFDYKLEALPDGVNDRDAVISIKSGNLTKETKIRQTR